MPWDRTDQDGLVRDFATGVRVDVDRAELVRTRDGNCGEGVFQGIGGASKCGDPCAVHPDH